MKFFLVITGPTAVGKTAFVNELAQHSKYPIEIVNGDMGQFYRPLSIGTAKPQWQKELIPHHLFDVVAEPIDFSAHAYRDMLLNTMHDIWARNAIPVIVGGSGFYLKSIFFPPAVSTGKQERCEKQATWQELFQLDPARAQSIHKHDNYRINRALDILKNTGKKSSDFQPAYSPPGSFFMLCLQRDKADLAQRIESRVLDMIKEGWLHEVANLDVQWIEFLKQKKLIGYTELIRYQEQAIHERDINKCIEKIQTSTRQYAKRQMTFWRSFKNNMGAECSLAELNLTFLDLTLYINQLVEHIIGPRYETI